MDKKKIFRYTLAVGLAAAVSAPLIAQVKNAQTAKAQAEQSQQAPAPQALPESAEPTSKPAEVDPNKVIASEGPVKVTAGEFEAVTASLPPQYQAALGDPAVKKRIADRIIQIKQLAAEAKRRDLQDKPQVKNQIEMESDQVLVNALAQAVQNGDDKENRAYYEANKSQFDNVQARHILIRTPGSPVPAEPGKKELTDAEAKAKAEQISQQLAKGGDFAAIAKAESDDKGSGLKGGDLGTFSPWKMDSDFSKATLGLKKNEVSAPVKSQFGYHVIQLLGDTPRTYEEAKGEVGEARWNEMINNLKKKDGKTEYDSSFFGTEPAAPATQPAAPAAGPVQAK